MNLENQLVTLQAEFQEVSAQLAKSDKELSVIKELNELLASQISKVTEREEAEGQEGSWDAVSKEKTNGHIQLEVSATLCQRSLRISHHFLIFPSQELRFKFSGIWRLD